MKRLWIGLAFGLSVLSATAALAISNDSRPETAGSEQTLEGIALLADQSNHAGILVTVTGIEPTTVGSSTGLLLLLGLAPMIFLATRAPRRRWIASMGLLAGVAVVVARAAPMPVLTSPDGSFAIRDGSGGLELGQYSLLFERAGYQSATAVVVVRESGATLPSGEVVLQPLPNNAPVLESIGHRTILLGQSLTFDLQASDADGDFLEVSVSPLPLPENFEFDVVERTLSFRPNAGQVGTETLTFVVSDGRLTDSETVDFTVPSPSPGGVTSLSGRVLDTNDAVRGKETPVVGATISLLDTGVSAVTAADGSFSLLAIPEGSQVLDIDVSTAAPAPDGSDYAAFREKIEIIGLVENVVERPFYLPRIEMASLTKVDPKAETVVTSPDTGVSLTVEASSALDPEGGMFDEQLSISLVPEGLAPAALPEALDPGLLITIQPVGVTFDPPAPLRFPNMDGLPANSETNLWSLDPVSGRFIIVGRGMVSSDGEWIETFSGGVRAADWHLFLPPSVSSDCRTNNANPKPNDQGSCPGGCGDTGTTVLSGKVFQELQFGNYSSMNQNRNQVLRYDSDAASGQMILRSDTTIVKRAAVPSQVSARLEMAGIQQSAPTGPARGSLGLVGELFTDTSALGENQDETFRQAFPADVSGLDSGLYDYRLELTSYYPSSAVSAPVEGKMVVHNLSQSLFGAGWSLKGLSQLIMDGTSYLILEGTGAAASFSVAALPPGSFDQSLTLDTGKNPRSVTPGHFNDDLLPDLAIPNQGDGTISIYLNQGGGSFALQQTLKTSNGPRTVDSGDFNGDGFTDLVVGTFAFNSVQGVYLHLGDETGMLGEEELLLQLDAFYVEALDIDGDKNLDILYTNSFGSSSRSVGALFGDGKGGFEHLSIGETGTSPISLMTGDLNEDGILDVAVVSVADDEIQIFLGLGNRRFQARTDYGVGDGPFDVVMGDFNSDGSLDLASANELGDSVSVLYGDGLGDFSAPINYPVGEENHSLVAHDFNGDGFLDLAVASAATDQLILLLSDGAGDFPRQVKLDTGSYPAWVHSEDLNQDGAPDLAVANFEGSSVTLFFAEPPLKELFFVGSAGDFSELRVQPDGSATRSFPNRRKVHYDPQGRQIATEDSNGNTTTYDYDGQGRLQSIQDPAEMTTTFTYSGDHLISITDPAGRVTRFEHDAFGNLVRVIDPSGASLQYLYNERHQLETRISKQGSLESFEYDSYGRNVKNDFPDGSSVEIAPVLSATLPDAEGKGLRGDPLPAVRAEDVSGSLTDAEGHIIEVKANRFGSTLEMTNRVNQRTTYVRDGNDLVTSFTRPSTAPTELDYDDRGNLIRITEAPGRSEERTRSLEYHPVFNRPTRITDGRKNVTIFEYDDDGNRTRLIDPLKGEVVFTYDERGMLSSITNEEDHTTQFEYDGQGNLVAIVDALGQRTELIRDAAGNITTRIDAAGTRQEATTTYTYDPLNQRLSRTDPSGLSVHYAYDQGGNVVRTTRRDGTVVLRKYDNRGRLSQVEDPKKGTTNYTYDESGNLGSITDARDSTWTYQYDNEARLTQQLDPEGGSVSFSYDGRGNLSSYTLSGGVTVSMAYDHLDRRTRLNPPGNNDFRFSYDQEDALVEIKDLALDTFTMTNDANGRRETLETPDDTLTYTYDGVGNLLTAANTNSLVELSYDGLNRPTQEKLTITGGPPTVTLDYDYDSLSRLSSITDSLGGVTTYGYNVDGQVETITEPSKKEIRREYTPKGLLARVHYGDELTTEYLYNSQSQLLEQETLRVEDKIVSEIRVTTRNQREEVVETVSLEEITQLSLDRLGRIDSITAASIEFPDVEETQEFYEYNLRGLLSRSHRSQQYLYNQDLLTETDSFLYTHDDNRRLQQREDKSSGETTTIEYNSLGQPAAFELSGGSTVNFRWGRPGPSNWPGRRRKAAVVLLRRLQAPSRLPRR